MLLCHLEQKQRKQNPFPLWEKIASSQHGKWVYHTLQDIHLFHLGRYPACSLPLSERQFQIYECLLCLLLVLEQTNICCWKPPLFRQKYHPATINGWWKGKVDMLVTELKPKLQAMGRTAALLCVSASHFMWFEEVQELYTVLSLEM